MTPGGTASEAGSHDASQPATGARRTKGQVVKDIALFFAAPFITLACLSLFPFIGLAMARQAWRHRGTAN